MQGYVALLLLGGISRSALAFSLAEDPQFPFKVPALDANRSPCPVLNALANHGYLPRDGMNINMEQLKFAFTKALNIDEKVTVKLAEPTFPISTTGNSSTVNLKDMEKHNVIEHDGSLSREDVAVTGNANKFDARVWNGVKAHFTRETIDTKTMAIARKDRVAVAMKTNPTFNMTEAQLKLSFAESAFILGVLAGDFQNPQAPTKYMNVMFEQERFPFDEGFKTSATKVTGDQVDMLVAAMMKVTPP
ncbi:putative sterigmatocystin biosynthesis peroxidase stcC [Colletotrichum siamense]|uniref:Sterigmatocystin biosynthesis peroxidase stcC n=1 Tax=Colletotrichum siamense TaxID=690259 RepID=A0A9P5EVE6_COLSI|nr:putative sterigmatocystin biosynthesis peroxidase stcC [Colletotrichum siamense]KAF4860002.1 putative sterigmatocystin biosynthesis peroxidase stcC [Colletotrichum siamense]